MNRKKLSFVFAIVISFCFISNVKAVYSDDKVGTYENELSKFPISYQEKIKELHKIYPNAIFVAQNKFFDWNKYKEIEVNWNKMLEAELDKGRSLIWRTAKSEYKGKAYNKEKTWYYATNAAVTYYMNPYNFLDKTHVFMFESQYFNNSENTEGIEKILSSYYKNKECPGSNGKTYAQVILEAGKANNVSAYMLASRLKQENGAGTSPLVTGKSLDGDDNNVKYGDITKDGKIDSADLLRMRQHLIGIKKIDDLEVGDITKDKKIDSADLLRMRQHLIGTQKILWKTLYYNFYNVQASGSSNSEVITNGIKCAAGKIKGCEGFNWNSPYSSIMGGAKFIYKKYIGINDTYNVKGQMTNYLQKWDPYGPNLGGHQYMQNITAPYTESESIYSSNITYKGYNHRYVFYIPIFKGAPNLN